MDLSAITAGTHLGDVAAFDEHLIMAEITNHELLKG